MGLPFWKEIIEEYTVKLCGFNVLNCCLGITMTDLSKIGLKMKNLAPKFPCEGGPCHSLHYPLPH